MRTMILACCFYLLGSLNAAVCRAQSKDSVKDSLASGVADGIINDLTGKHGLRFATVSIYNTSDSTLVSYQLTNNWGEFHFKNLPIDIQLELVVSSPGYNSQKKVFVVPADKRKVVVAPIFLEKAAVALKEVTIRFQRPPMQMRGDTIEFNAEAFKLDRNAVVEDLLRKLPGVTVWGDGKITVNGKTVQTVLVEGKPFFGQNGTVATQNLPKLSVDKIQVYSTKDPRRSALDSILNVNIVLKKNAKSGMFGKIGAGYGTTERYNSDGMLSLFDPKNQLSLVGASNNINIVPDNISLLMKNSSFKGVGANVEYQPNFNMQGVNRSSAAGIDYTHFFVPVVRIGKESRLNGNYFMNASNTELIRDTRTTIALGSTELLQDNKVDLRSSGLKHRSGASYVLQNDRLELFARVTGEWNSQDRNTSSAYTSRTASQGLQSVNLNDVTESDKQRYYAAKFTLEDKALYYKIEYDGDIFQNDNVYSNRIDFRSPVQPSQNFRLDRITNSALKRFSNGIELKYGNLKGLIFGKKDLYQVGLGVLNYAHIGDETNNSVTDDIDTLTYARKRNGYLTNISRYRTLDERPGVRAERTFVQQLTNRYKKTVYIYAEGRAQIYQQRNVSQRDFQNFERSYTAFLPMVAVNYLNDQFGHHHFIYDLSYRTSTTFPSVQQIAPIIDSANLYYIQRGNPGLRSSYRNELAFSWKYVSFDPKNLLDNFNISVKASQTNNIITDSLTYDGLGRAINYSVNMSGARSANLYADLQKAVKFKDDQIQIGGSVNATYSENPGYFNGRLNRSDNSYQEYALNLLYSHKDQLVVEAKQRFSNYRSLQRGIGYVYSSELISTVVSASANLTARANISSNVSFNRNSTSNTPPRDFKIWNASITYRFFRGNQAELKLSALDLLHQNNSFINYGDNNSLTVGTVNVLQQYFMFSFAYYPRKFGNTDKSK